MNAILAVDGGQTQVRFALFTDAARPQTGQLPGLDYSGDPDGIHTITTLVKALASHVPAETHLDTVALTLTGMPGAATTRTSIGQMVHEYIHANRVIVTSDLPAAYLGALGPTPGVVISAGSGAIALALDGHGGRCSSGGGGALLGDDGSGYWIGHHALREAWRVHTGRAGSIPLFELATRRYGSLSSLPSRLRASNTQVSEVAAFVPDVATAAEGGDPVATGLLQRAGQHLAGILAAAATGVPATEDAATAVPTASWSGRLLHLPALRATFAEQVAKVTPHLALAPPRGSTLDGAHLLAQLGDLSILGGDAQIVPRSKQSRVISRGTI